jgi:hypothetical protein
MTVFSLGFTHMQQEIAQDMVGVVLAFLRHSPHIFKPLHHYEILSKIRSSLLARFGGQHKTRALIVTYIKHLFEYLESQEKPQDQKSVSLNWTLSMTPIYIFFPIDLDSTCLNSRLASVSSETSFAFTTTDQRLEWLESLPDLSSLHAIDLERLLDRLMSNLFLQPSE